MTSDQRDADPEAPHVPEAGVGHVLAVEAGDRGRHGDDRRPRRQLLHDVVHPGVGQRHVRVEDRRDQVAQRLGPLDDAQHVVVEVVVVRDQLAACSSPPTPRRTVVTTSRIGSIARRASTSERRSTNVRRDTSFVACAVLVEEQVLDLVDLAVEVVERRRSSRRRSRRAAPWSSPRGPHLIRSALSSQRSHDRVDVEHLVQPDGDDRALRAERRDAGRPSSSSDSVSMRTGRRSGTGASRSGWPSAARRCASRPRPRAGRG